MPKVPPMCFHGEHDFPTLEADSSVLDLRCHTVMFVGSSMSSSKEVISRFSGEAKKRMYHQKEIGADGDGPELPSSSSSGIVDQDLNTPAWLRMRCVFFFLLWKLDPPQYFSVGSWHNDTLRACRTKMQQGQLELHGVGALTA